MKYDKIETGVNLRQLRIENKLSPGEVSDIVDKSESHIMQLERGSRNLTVEMLCKFADVYNTDPNTILGISSQRMVVMIDKLKSLPTETSEQLIGTFISVIDNRTKCSNILISYVFFKLFYNIIWRDRILI